MRLDRATRVKPKKDLPFKLGDKVFAYTYNITTKMHSNRIPAEFISYTPSGLRANVKLSTGEIRRVDSDCVESFRELKELPTTLMDEMSRYTGHIQPDGYYNK